ncbi:AAA family ATPase [Rhodoferax sp. OV413]|uniref:AAA family ATPase n=1 Tax=Rhodoferax sp. OV413 TaxID=1855285 RepID=UPI000B811BCF|nr:AAA family ATPase [Rhodoferax sp. OV413]
MPMAEAFTYRRTALAASYCDALEGRGILDATSGLFLAAPRRTGKSTFLREDMVPEMRARGWQTLYVDLWSDRSRDPAELIIGVVRETLAQLDGPVLKAAKSVGLDKLTVLGTLSLDLGKIGQPGGATLADALERLHAKSGKPLVLLVDEAQHALSSDAGTQAMFALKAARDRLNQGTARRGLHLVMTGSNRDKLTHLVLRKSEPFYGAGVTRFPLLDRGFVEAYAAWLNPQFADGKAFSVATLERAFELVGRRPEMLKRVVGEAVADLGGAQALDALIERNAQHIQHRAWQEFASTYNGLPDPQKAVLDAIARLSPDYTPFAEAALTAYQAVLGKPLSNSAIQGALDALRDKELIWRAGRGDYAFEDDGLRAWYLEQHPQPPALVD